MTGRGTYDLAKSRQGCDRALMVLARSPAFLPFLHIFSASNRAEGFFSYGV